MIPNHSDKEFNYLLQHIQVLKDELDVCELTSKNKKEIIKEMYKCSDQLNRTIYFLYLLASDEYKAHKEKQLQEKQLPKRDKILSSTGILFCTNSNNKKIENSKESKESKESKNDKEELQPGLPQFKI